MVDSVRTAVQNCIAAGRSAVRFVILAVNGDSICLFCVWDRCNDRCSGTDGGSHCRCCHVSVRYGFFDGIGDRISGSIIDRQFGEDRLSFGIGHCGISVSVSGDGDRDTRKCLDTADVDDQITSSCFCCQCGDRRKRSAA